MSYFSNVLGKIFAFKVGKSDLPRLSKAVSPPGYIGKFFYTGPRQHQKPDIIVLLIKPNILV